MPHLRNVEFKARCADPEAARAALRTHGAEGPVHDHQVDTYFRVPSGRLKLREGTVERALIHYARPDTAGPKRSDVTLCPTPADATALKQVLAAALGVAVVVDKRREIYRAGNVKLHLDEVAGLGTFVEVEAIATEDQPEPTLHAQCSAWLDALGVRPEDLVAGSYADLLADPAA